MPFTSFASSISNPILNLGMADLQRKWSNQAADTQFARTKELQLQQQNWQEQMSNTAYQRSADDLEKAGLNRILAIGSPGSTPSGGLGSAQGASIAMGKADADFGGQFSKIEAAKLAKQNQQLVDEQIDTQIENQKLMASQSAKALAEARESNLRGDRLSVMNPVFEQIGFGTKEASNLFSPLVKEASSFWGDPSSVQQLKNSIGSRFVSGAKGIGQAFSSFSKLPGNYVSKALDNVKPSPKPKSSRVGITDVFKKILFK